MLNNDLDALVRCNFSHTPTKEQAEAIRLFSKFLLGGNAMSAFILNGYAGTGKTSLVAALVKTLKMLNRQCVLLAPTGRAAKVLSQYTGVPAYTIHKKIYRQKAFSEEPGQFSLNKNMHRNALFIVDEASMIANDGLSGSLFGTGRLLDDLVTFVYAEDTGCRLLFLGDTAQLPPVGEEASPALESEYLRGYGLDVLECTLKEVVRQEHDSGILYNATTLRSEMEKESNVFELPKIVTKFPDITPVKGAELIEQLENSYRKVGMDETIVICRSNKRAGIFNNGIRNTILYREDELNSGDILMVAKNNYYWSTAIEGLDFIANGDIAVVKRVRKTQELYGFRFATVLLAFPDYGDVEIEAKILLDTLQAETPALTSEQNRQLFYAILEDYADLPTKKQRYNKIKEDPYYNALQVKYAYAVTCHKAQGGQWAHVYIDQGYVTKENLTPDYYRWLYTAFTRATEHLYLVNWSDECLSS